MSLWPTPPGPDNLAPINDLDKMERVLAVPIDASIDISATEALRRDVGDDAFQRLVGIFAQECDRNCREIGEFLKERDLAGGEIVAHRFKSTARQFGANGLAEICQELERACATGQGDEAHELFDALALVTPQILGNLNDATGGMLKNG